MMKRLHLSLLMLLIGVWAMALDTSVKNADGVEIWYELDSNTKTASVTYKGELYYTYNDEYIGNVVIPSKVTYEGVEYSVTEIVNYAFRDCSGLTSVTIPDGVTEIGYGAFTDCSGLTSVTIPEGVTEIGSFAFSGCSSLTSITIPKSVTEIGSFAFSGCSGLTSVTIPESVTLIGEGAFSGCSGLTSIEVASGNENYISVDGVLFNKDMTSLIQYLAGKDAVSYTIPEGVMEIVDYAFYGCSGLTSVTIPEGVTEIGSYAFYGCSGLTSVKIPEGVTEIGGGAFEECSGLTSVTIPDGVTEIGVGAFYNCSGLTSVTIPESVTEIGHYAFFGTAIYNNESNWENNVLYIDNCLIEVKSDLSGEYVIKEDTRLIASYAFYGCSGLTSVTIPEGVTEIGSYAFYGFSSLTSITIPKSVTEIGSFAFSYCSGLTSIEVALGNENYIAVDGVLFNKDMTSLIRYPAGKDAVSYSIPEGVTEIGYCAFEDCSGLTSVTIPEGVTDIDYSAFSNCSSLTSITSMNVTPPSINSDSFYDVDKSIPVYVPKQSVEAYKSADGWKEFTNILPIKESVTSVIDNKIDNISVRPIGNNIVVTGTDNYTVYSISGQSFGKVTSVERGIYIVVAEGKSYKVAIK